MQIGKLSVLFYRYFYNKVDAFKYDNALKLLQKVEQFKQLDCSNEWLIEFTKKYYEMKVGWKIHIIMYKNMKNQ